MSVSKQVVAFLEVLTRGVSIDDALLFRERGGRGYRSSLSLSVKKIRDAAPHLPDAVLGILERSPSPWTVSTRTRDGFNAARVVSESFPKECFNLTKPASPCGRDWHWREDLIAAFIKSLDAPTMVIEARPFVAALFSLDEPTGNAGVDIPVPGLPVRCQDPSVVVVTSFINFKEAA